MHGCDRPAKAGDPSAPRSTLAGVYTTDQAAYGKEVYEGSCYSCHLSLGNHTGPVFRAHWTGRGLSDLFRYISATMPKNDPGTLSPEDNAALTAYLLQLNGMPAGSVAVSTDTLALRVIRIDTVGTKR
jgi:mono/diheme cytochrome c family protein